MAPKITGPVFLLSLDQTFTINVQAAFLPICAEFRVIRDLALGKTILESPSPGIIFFDPATTLPKQGQTRDELMALALRHPNCVICYEGGPEEAITTLAEHGSVNHVFAKSNPFYAIELASIAGKMQSGNIWGIHNYLGDHAQVVEFTVTDSRQRDDFIKSIERQAKLLGAFPDFANMLTTVAWELVMNAIYSAPMDVKTRQPKYDKVPRTQEIQLAPNETVQLAHGIDSNSFVISVTDKFGRLTRDQTIKSLAHGIKRAEGQVSLSDGGAGIGLTMLINSASQVNFNIKQGEKTEVVALVFPSKRQRDFLLHGPSINFFVS